MFGLFKKKKYPKVAPAGGANRFEVKIFRDQKKVKFAFPDNAGLFVVAFVDWHLGYYGSTPAAHADYRGAVEAFIADPSGPTWPLATDVQPEDYIGRGGTWAGNGIAGFGGSVGGPSSPEAAIIEATKTLIAASDARVIAALKHLLQFSAEDDPASNAYLHTKNHFPRINEAWRLAG